MAMDAFFCKLAEDAKALCASYLKAVIFCRKYSDWKSSYFRIRRKLCSHFTHPADTLHLQECCLVDMFTATSILAMRQELLTSFVEAVRFVFL